jgi:hypothetical protein
MMSKLKQYKPIQKDLFFKINILKTMMYCGVLWGLYHQQGWAMTSDQDDIIFPFWLNGIQAHKYAKKNWPNYTPRRITPRDFEVALLPTLTRLKVTPALYSSNNIKLKLTTMQMRHFFFSTPNMRTV